MKTLILSCNTGEGHNSCAKAVKEYCDMVGDECSVYDGLRFVSPTISEFTSWGHVYIYRHLPRLFKVGYRYTENHPTVFREKAGLYRMIAVGSERLYHYILDGGFDAVICTHIFAALMLTDMLKKHPLNIATSLVTTDYTCTPGTKNTDLDYYFIPAVELMSDFASVNIPKEKMVACGIPIRQMFYEFREPAAAKAAQGIAPTHKHLVVMCGSMGCGPIEKILQKILKKRNIEWEITVICGTNQKLERKLNKRYRDHAYIHIRGFVQDMSLVMDSADLCLMKPGGISVSEALAKAMPMVLIDAVAGCEAYNRRYFLQKGGAATAANIQKLADTCIRLMEDDRKREKMVKNLVALQTENAAETIYLQMKKRTEELYAG